MLEHGLDDPGGDDGVVEGRGGEVTDGSEGDDSALLRVGVGELQPSDDCRRL